MTDDTKIAIEACCQATSGFGPRSVGPSSFWIGRKSVRSKFNLLSVRSDSISKNVGPTHWTGPDRDRTEVVHPWSSECYLDLHLSLLLLFDYLRTWQWSFLMKALNL